MDIRKHRLSDRAQILELLRMNTPAYFAPSEEKDLVEYLYNHSANHYVLEIDNRIVGCGGFNLAEDGKTAKISWDFFHPEMQAKGFGTRLMKHRLEKIKENAAVKNVSVRTSQFAFKFYERFGLKLKETQKDFWAKGYDLYHMEGDLSTALALSEKLLNT
jgi:N-acetylglutamate synthase-like GNAT family acetyltransferase